MQHNDHVSRIQQQWAEQRPDLDTTPQGIIGRLHRLANYLTEELCAVYAEHGLTEAEFDVLATLRRAGEPFSLAPGELALQTMVTTGAMTKRLDKLVGSGWVTRTQSGEDRRGRLISLTASGKEKIDEAFAAHMRNEKRLVEQLSPAERPVMENLLRNWLAHHEQPGP